MVNPDFDAFTQTVERVLSVPKTEILRREEEYRKRAALNPNKRGPKPKRKRLKRTSASRVPAERT